MDKPIIGLITWKHRGCDESGKKELYFKFLDGSVGWQHYSALPQTMQIRNQNVRLRMPDYPMPKGSQGYATMQHLLATGLWRYARPDEV